MMEAYITNEDKQQIHIDMMCEKLEVETGHTTLVTDEEERITLVHLQEEVRELRIENEHIRKETQVSIEMLQKELNNSTSNYELMSQQLQDKMDEMQDDIQQLKEHQQQDEAANISITSLFPQRTLIAMPSILQRNIINDDGLPLDTFTLMMISRVRSRVWVLAILTFSLQMTLIVMIGINQIKDSVQSSLFNVPFKVDGVVRTGQLITIIFTLATQNDIISSVRFLVMFWGDPRWDRALLRRHEGAPPPTNILRVVHILLPNGLKLTQGLLVTCTSFVVIVQSDNIIDLLKDFTALMVMSEADNIFFWLAVNGFLGSKLQRKTIEARDIDIQDEVTATYINVNNGATTSVTPRNIINDNGGFVTRSLILLSIGMAMVGGWLYIVCNQLNGTYFHHRYPDCKPPDDQPNMNMFVLAKAHFGDEICYGGPLNTLGCEFEGGDCVNFNLAFPLCKGTNRIDVQEHVGNGKCEEIFRGFECDFDGGDCCPNTVVDNISFGDGQCNGGISSTEACNFDNGDCNAFRLTYPDCPFHDLSRIKGADDVMIGDGVCNSGGGIYNSYKCGYEFGDCNQYQIGQDVYVPDHFELLFDKDIYFNTDISLGGTTMAIGLPYNDKDGNFDSSNSSSGLAKILRYDSTRKMWLQLGNNIAASSNGVRGLGHTLSLSFDGNRVAIQSSLGLQIFDFHHTSSVGDWSQVGQTITAAPSEMLVVTAMSMTADGLRVAQIQSDGEIHRIRIYELLESSSVTRQQRWVNDDQNVINLGEGGSDDKSSYTKLKFNAMDGSKILCSSNHVIKLYQLNPNPNSKSWTQMGQGIEHSSQDSIIKSFAISADGSRIAVSLNFASSTADASGQVHVFDYANHSNNEWVPIGNPIKSISPSNRYGFGYSINMSSDGNLLVIASNNPRCQEYNKIQFNIDECSTGSIELYNYFPLFNRFQEVLPNSASPYKVTGNILNLTDLINTSGRSIVFGLHFSMSSGGDVLSISGYNVDDQAVFVRFYDFLDELFYSKCAVDRPEWIGDGNCRDFSPYNSKECGFDGGDCVPKRVDGYPNCFVHNPDLIDDGRCDGTKEPYNTEACGFDGGDCSIVEGYPGCLVQNPDLIGNGDCDKEIPYFTKACGFDGGDCIAEGYPKCIVGRPDEIGNGDCYDKPPYNSKECGFDGGDCIPSKSVKGYPNCTVYYPEEIDNGSCWDWPPYNTVECGIDGGDCDRKPVEGYPKCFVHSEDRVGDGKCRNYPPYNTEECGFDGGDCLHLFVT